MSDFESDPQESTTKPKRQLSEKQLASLAKARAIRLQQRKQDKEVTQKKKQIKKLVKEKTSKEVDTEYKALLLELDKLQKKNDYISAKKEFEMSERPKKSKKLPTYTDFESDDDDSDDDDADEIVVKKTVRRKAKKATKPVPKPLPPAPKPADPVQQASKEVVQDKINRLRDEMLYKSIFPS